ncbi:hypothetical protein [Pelagovum pacificum]|nr:hypothetical protein [Pelagovum pacificum]QQA41278.1 hypothetical protein I8N54_10585 [Pelagovum pacificum]
MSAKLPRDQGCLADEGIALDLIDDEVDDLTSRDGPSMVAMATPGNCA